MIVSKDLGDYIIYSDGKIWSKYKKNWLKTNQCKKGYLRITFRGKTHNVHRLIGLHFLENPHNYPQIDHLNGDKTDNRAENLEWVTQSTNITRSYKNGTHPVKLTNADVLEIRDYYKRNQNVTQKEIAELWNTNQPTISRILSNERRKNL